MRWSLLRSVSLPSIVALCQGYGEIRSSTSPFCLFPSYAWGVTTCGSSKLFHVFFCEIMCLPRSSATVEPTSQLRIISLRSCRSITFQITGHGRNSTYTKTKYLKSHIYVVVPAGSRRLLRKCVLCKGCDEIVGLRSARPRMAPNKTRRGSFEPTTRPRALRGPRGIDGYIFPPLFLDLRL